MWKTPHAEQALCRDQFPAAWKIRAGFLISRAFFKFFSAAGCAGFCTKNAPDAFEKDAGARHRKTSGNDDARAAAQPIFRLGNT
jgi:hypothetical protein